MYKNKCRNNVCVCVCVNVCVHACMCECVHVCVCVCMHNRCVSVYICASASTHVNWPVFSFPGQHVVRFQRTHSGGWMPSFCHTMMPSWWSLLLPTLLVCSQPGQQLKKSRRAGFFCITPIVSQSVSHNVYWFICLFVFTFCENMAVGKVNLCHKKGELLNFC